MALGFGWALSAEIDVRIGRGGEAETQGGGPCEGGGALLQPQERLGLPGTSRSWEEVRRGPDPRKDQLR